MGISTAPVKTGVNIECSLICIVHMNVLSSLECTLLKSCGLILACEGGRLFDFLNVFCTCFSSLEMSVSLMAVVCITVACVFTELLLVRGWSLCAGLLLIRLSEPIH